MPDQESEIEEEEAPKPTTSRVTKGGLVGLIAGVGLAAIFPPLGAALVIAGTVSGAALGRALDREESEDDEEAPAEETGDSAKRLLNEFEAWDRQITSGKPRLPSPTRPAPKPASTHASPSGPSLYEQVAEAESLLKAGRFLEAIDRFRELKGQLLEASSKVGPSDRQRIVDGLRLALHRLAGVLIENDSPGEAEELLKESLDLAPGDRDTLLHLGRLQMMIHQPASAELYLLEAVTAHPSDPEAYRLLGDLYVESGEEEKARALFQRALDRSGDAAVTVEMLERISALDPADPQPLIELGRVHLQEANWEEAGRAFRQALSRDPSNAYVQRRLGTVALHRGQVEEGLRLLKGAPDLNDDIPAVAALAHHYAAIRSDDEALPLLRRLREIDRSFGGLDPVQHRSELRRHGVEGDQVDALYAALRVQALLDGAAVEARIGDVEEAAAALNEALSYGGTGLGAGAVDVAAALAAEFERRGNPREARRWTEEMTRLGGSLERLRQDRDTYEEFLQRFRYRPQDLLAEGGMARVYRGTDTRTGRTVAIKRMHDRFCTDPQAVSYFYREVRALEELSRPYPHPNIVEFISSGITESRFIFAMELVEGPSLRHVLERGDVWTLEQICQVAEGICSGLDRAHQSIRAIVHRDLKPENVLLTEEMTPKLTDFGICRVSSLFSASRRYYGGTRSFVGTSLYSAPEQYPDPYSGQVDPVDARADIYSLGSILYELLTTQPPFTAADPGHIGLMHQRRPLPGQTEPQSLVPPSQRNPLAMDRFSIRQRDRLDAIVMRCLEAKPARRYRSARELQADLVSLRTEEQAALPG